MTEPTDGARYQLSDHERRISNLERHEVGVLSNRVANLELAVSELKTSVNGMTKVMWTLAIALVGAALTLAVAIASGSVG